MTEIEFLRNAIIDGIMKTTDADLLDFIRSILRAEASKNYVDAV